jgi:diacylglycerol kinase family enzyme
MPQRVILIHSPHSGRSSQLPVAIKHLEQAGPEVVSSISIADIDDLPAQGTLWKESGVAAALAAGGDGLVGGVVTHIAESGLPLGILPLGTSNDIARALHIPQDIGEAAHVIAQGREQEVDIGVAQSAEQTTRSGTPSQSGSLPAKVIPQSGVCFAHALTVGVNVQFAIAGSSFEDRLLDIVVFEHMDMGTLGKSIVRSFGPQKHVEAPLATGERRTFTHHPAELSGIPGIHHVQAAGVTITTSTDPREVTFDGEVRGQTPMYVHVADKRLRMRIPDQVGTT